MIGIICALNLGVYNAFGIAQIIPLIFHGRGRALQWQQFSCKRIRGQRDRVPAQTICSAGMRVRGKCGGGVHRQHKREDQGNDTLQVHAVLLLKSVSIDKH